MTDTAERIVKLAGRFDPEPPRSMRPDRENPPEWLAWWRRDGQRNTFLAIATPGALLGALVDLFDFALAGKGWYFSTLSNASGVWCCGLGNSKKPGVFGTGPTAAAALLAAMEGI